MANELNIQLDPFNQTGLVLLGKVFDKDGTQQGTSVTLTENAPALYSGDFSLSSISNDAYLVRFETNLPDELYGTGVLYVRNNAEVSQENFFSATLDVVVTDTASRDASKADVSGIETKTEADSRQVILISEHNQTQTDISNLNDFNPASDSVTTDAASRLASQATVSNLATQSSVNNIPTSVDSQLTTSHGSGSWQQTTIGTVSANITQVNGSNVNIDDFKADVTDVATKDNQESINNNVKKASLLIPANENLPDA